MGNWGISPNADIRQKLKSDMADFLHGLNSTGIISYEAYDKLFDFTLEQMDKMYDLGKKEALKK